MSTKNRKGNSDAKSGHSEEKSRKKQSHDAGGGKSPKRHDGPKPSKDHNDHGQKSPKDHNDHDKRRSSVRHGGGDTPGKAKAGGHKNSVRHKNDAPVPEIVSKAEVHRKSNKEAKLSTKEAQKRHHKAGGGSQIGFFDKVLISLGLSYEPVQLKTKEAIDAMVKLNLMERHLGKLKSIFDSIDLDRSGVIDRDEFMKAIGEPRSPYTDHLFALIDADNSGTIDFEEFVRVMATYCIYTREEIIRFCFTCFDEDDSGVIDDDEFLKLLGMVNSAPPQFPQNFRSALTAFDTNKDGMIDYGEFHAIADRFPVVLFPAFRLQDAMQKKSLGDSWIKIMEGMHRKKQEEDSLAMRGGASAKGAGGGGGGCVIS